MLLWSPILISIQNYTLQHSLQWRTSHLPLWTQQTPPSPEACEAAHREHLWDWGTERQPCCSGALPGSDAVSSSVHCPPVVQLEPETQMSFTGHCTAVSMKYISLLLTPFSLFTGNHTFFFSDKTKIQIELYLSMIAHLPTWLRKQLWYIEAKRWWMVAALYW